MINEIRTLHDLASQAMLAVIPDSNKPVALDPHTRQAIMLLSDAVVSLRNAAKNLELRDKIEPRLDTTPNRGIELMEFHEFDSAVM